MRVTSVSGNDRSQYPVLLVYPLLREPEGCAVRRACFVFRIISVPESIPFPARPNQDRPSQRVQSRNTVVAAHSEGVCTAVESRKGQREERREREEICGDEAIVSAERTRAEAFE